MHYKNIAIVSGLFLILGFIGYHIYQYIPATSPLEPDQNASTTESVNVSTSTTPAVTKPKPAPSIKIPDLDRPVIVTVSGISPESHKKIEEKIANIIFALKQNKDDFGSWMELGLERNSIGDYEGARDAWEYASIIRPQNSLSFGNLGFVYGYYLKEPLKAEKNYLQAIKNDPKMSYLYLQTFEFYRDVLKNNLKARAILEQGLRDNPGDSALQAALATL